jgi:pimeloyl-ACP methyl ester carboxylesterase/predicted MFS family arabinose efflux permease
MSARGRLYLLFGQIFVFQLGFGLVVPILPLYVQRMDLDATGVGVVIGVYGLARVLADLPAASLATRLGHGRAMGLGALVLTVGSVMTAFAGSLAELLAYRFVAGAGAAVTLVVGQAMAAAIPGPYSRGRAISLYHAAFLAGVGLGPVLGGPLAELLGLQAPFLVYGALAGGVGLVGVLVGSPEGAGPGGGRPAHGHVSPLSYLAILRDLPFLMVSLVTLMMHFTRTGGLHGMVPLLGADRYQMSTGQIGLAIGINGMLNLALTLVVGVVADRVPRRALLIPGTGALVASLAMFGLGSAPWVFVSAAALWGLGTGLTGPATAVYVAERAVGDVTGPLALYRMLSDVGYLTGPILMGLSAGAIGIPLTFLWCAVLMLLAAVGFHVVSSPHRGQAAPPAAGPPAPHLVPDLEEAPAMPEPAVPDPAAERPAPGAAAQPGPYPHLTGPLAYEVRGPEGAPLMVFVHPNPFDATSWLYQMTHFSTWFRCVAVDLPGYGTSPAALEGVTMEEIAAAVWDAVDEAGGDAELPVVVVGCSIGSHIAEHMYHLRPERTGALVLSGTGWRPVREFVPRRVAQYEQHGLTFRRQHALEDFSPEFRRTPVAEWFADLLVERNDTADAASIVAMFRARTDPDPDWLFADLHAPVLIVSGTEDSSHAAAFALHERLPRAEIVPLPGAGHACYFEQPWEFDAEVLAFLDRVGHLERVGVGVAVPV